ncbi:hypothetical protein ACYZT3_08930 [Pseudomonas sp. MDT1-16]
MSNSNVITVGAQYQLDGRIYEVINITETLISLRDVHGKRAQYFSPDDFKGALFRKEITLFQHAPLQESTAIFFTNSEDPRVVEARRKYHYVQGLKSLFQGSLPKKLSLIEIQKLAKQYGDASPPGYSSVCKWTQLCMKNNWLPFSLLKQKSAVPRGKLTPDNTASIIDRYITEIYLSDQQNTIVYVHRLIKGQIIHDNIDRRENNAKLIHQPSLSTVRRRIIKLCGFRTDTCRLGSRLAQKKNKFGEMWSEPERLLEQVEMDCTPVDVQLVDKQGSPIGRIAHLSAMLEVKSSKIIAYELSSTPPCAEKTLRVMKMALEAKLGEELHRGKMQELIVDNGIEVANSTIKNIAQVLGIQIRYVPPKTPDAKPHIERFFKTMNTQFIHGLPGTTFSNPVERGDYDSEAKACLTLEQLQNYFSKWLEGFYHNNPQGGQKTSPNEKWDRAIARQLPPEKFSERDLDQLLRNVHRRTISGGRVKLFGLQWTGPGLAEMERRLKPGQKATIYVNNSNLGEVFVALSDRTEELFRATATLPAYQNNLTLYEHDLVARWMTQHNAQLSPNLAIRVLYEIRQELMRDVDLFAKSRKQKTKIHTTHNANLTSILDGDRPKEPMFVDEQGHPANELYETFYISKPT